jgi:hypothetical protein
MNLFAFNYAPIRFLPYREVGEFVNVGVVVHCPQTSEFDFRLVPVKRTARVKGFFPELNTKVFKAALQGISRELELQKARADQQRLPNQRVLPPPMAQAQVTWFAEFVRRREGLLHFGEPGTLIAESAGAALDELFGRYVERQFAQPREYQETIMRARLAGYLRDWRLNHLYQRNVEVGDEDFYVVMPFGHFEGEAIARAIKPLGLDKAESSDVYQHGGTWVKNMERLKIRQQLPRSVIFAVQLPPDGKRLRAATEICSELQQLGVEPVDFADIHAVRTAVQLTTAA